MISYFSGRARESFDPNETALRGRRPGDPGRTGETTFRYDSLHKKTRGSLDSTQPARPP